MLHRRLHHIQSAILVHGKKQEMSREPDDHDASDFFQVSVLWVMVFFEKKKKELFKVNIGVRAEMLKVEFKATQLKKKKTAYKTFCPK